jgi:hypothetical protein
MPIFKTTYNILKKQDEDEIFNRNWEESYHVQLPPRVDWDYSRGMKLEDVDIWEVLYEASNGIGFYASWLPYAEFYMITTGIDYRYEARIINTTPYWERHIELFYGQCAQKNAVKRAKELDIPLCWNEVWVDDELLWLYQDQQYITKKK